MLGEWALRRMDRPPDEAIGGQLPYMLRWWIIPKSPFGNIYLHQFLRDDDDRALHDHPWPSVSLLLATGYYEHVPGACHWRPPGAVIFRRAKAAHRISLVRDGRGIIIPAVSLFFTGPRIRSWGFHCPGGWVHWRDYVAMTPDGNEIGRGCGEK